MGVAEPPHARVPGPDPGPVRCEALALRRHHQYRHAWAVRPPAAAVSGGGHRRPQPYGCRAAGQRAAGLGDHAEAPTREPGVAAGHP